MPGRRPMNEPDGRSCVPLAELVATLSLGTDLGLGQPMEHVLRQCLIALRLSERFGRDEAQRRGGSYSGLLAWVGCFTDAYEQAKWFGDDIAMKADSYEVSGSGIGYLLGHIGLGKSWTERIRLGVTFLGDGRRAILSMLENHYLATDE